MAMGRDSASLSANPDVGGRKKRPRVSGGGVRLEQVKRACEPCRRSKLKCQSALPCSQCISRGIEQCCVPSGETGRLSLSETTEGAALRNPAGAHGASAHQAPGVEVLSGLPMGELGWKKDDLRKYVESLPPAVRSRLDAGLQSAQRSRDEDIESRKLKREDSTSSISSRAASETLMEGSLEQDFWSGHPTIGVFQVTYDSATGTPVEIYMNQRFATLLGYPQRQECLACIAANNLPLTVPDVDLTFMILKDLEHPDSMVDECPLRLVIDGTPTHLRTQRQRVFNRAGRLVRSTNFWELVSHQKWATLRDKYWRCGSGPVQGSPTWSRAASTSSPPHSPSAVDGDVSYPDTMIGCSLTELQAHPEGAKVVRRLCEVGDAVLRVQRQRALEGEGVQAPALATQAPPSSTSLGDNRPHVADPEGAFPVAQPAADAKPSEHAKTTTFTGPAWGEALAPAPASGLGAAPRMAPGGYAPLLLPPASTDVLLSGKKGAGILPAALEAHGTAWDRSKLQGFLPFGVPRAQHGHGLYVHQHRQQPQQPQQPQHQQHQQPGLMMPSTSQAGRGGEAWGHWEGGDSVDTSHTNLLLLDPFSGSGIWGDTAIPPPAVFDPPALNPSVEAAAVLASGAQAMEKTPASCGLGNVQNLSM